MSGRLESWTNGFCFDLTPGVFRSWRLAEVRERNYTKASLLFAYFAWFAVHLQSSSQR
jgi:hypothetical protein